MDHQALPLAPVLSLAETRVAATISFAAFTFGSLQPRVCCFSTSSASRYCVHRCKCGFLGSFRGELACPEQGFGWKTSARQCDVLALKPRQEAMAALELESGRIFKIVGGPKLLRTPLAPSISTTAKQVAYRSDSRLNVAVTA